MTSSGLRFVTNEMLVDWSGRVARLPRPEENRGCGMGDGTVLVGDQGACHLAGGPSHKRRVFAAHGHG